MALTSNALTTVATLAAELGIDTPAAGSTTEALLERLIAVASDAIESFCDRSFTKATVTEKVPGYGTATLRLSRYPLISVSAVSLDGTSVSTDYWATTPETADSEAGLLRHLEGDWEHTADYQGGAAPELQVGTERPLYSVTYVGGYVLPQDATEASSRTLPYPLEHACLEECVGMYRSRGRDMTITSESLLSAARTYGAAGSDRGASGLLLSTERRVAAYARWS